MNEEITYYEGSDLNNHTSAIAEASASALKGQHGDKIAYAFAGTAITFFITAALVISFCGVYYKSDKCSFSIPKTRLIR